MIGEAVEMFSKINSLDNLQEIVCERSLTLHEHGQQNGLKYFLKKVHGKGDRFLASWKAEMTKLPSF